MKTLCLWLVRLWFRCRHSNVDVLKTPGPVLLLPNHVSWLDWMFLLAVLVFVSVGVVDSGDE